VSYPSGYAELLLASASLTPAERYTLVDDMFASMLAGRTSAVEFLDFCSAFTHERDLIVWRALVGRLRLLGRFVDDEYLDAFGAVVGELVAPLVSEVGWDVHANESGRERELRSVVLDASGTIANDPSTIAHAREVHASFLGGADVDPDVVAASVSIVSHHGTEDDFDAFVDRFRGATTPQEQLRYLYALGQFPTTPLVQRALDLAVSGDVRTQNAPFLVQRALRNRSQGAYTWAFVRDHWSYAIERFPSNLVVRMLEGVLWLLDDDVAADVATFLGQHPFAHGERTIRQHVERLQLHVAARRRESAALTAALANEGR
jgi:aminopeptidase N